MSTAPARRHAPALTAAVLAVLLLHGLLLRSTLGFGSPPHSALPLPAPAPVLQTRTVVLARTSATPLDAANSVPAATAEQAPVLLTQTVPTARPFKTAPLQATAQLGAETPAAVTPDPTTDPATGPTSASRASPNPARASTPGAESGIDIETMGDADPQAHNTPLYTTAPAPAATLLYHWQRGPLQGQAQLRWLPQAPTEAAAAAQPYQLLLQFEAAGLPPSGWSSVGHLEAHGLAPERYSEWRRKREVRATNFQRDSQTVSFSAQGAVLPLPGGIQDRSSWMLQLGAVLQANPRLAEIGGQVTLPVVGTRGRPEAWTFTVLQRALLETPAGPVADALQLLREPRRPYDTRVTVWLDPARHHLPLDLQLAVHGVGEVQRWRLLSLQWE